MTVQEVQNGCWDEREKGATVKGQGFYRPDFLTTAGVIADRYYLTYLLDQEYRMIGQEATVSEQANKTTMNCWSPH
jgi:hypothetical protein